MNKNNFLNFLRPVSNETGLIGRKAFTLIELLVVITIIMVITSSGTLYFFKFLDSRGIKNDIEIIKNNIKTFDLKIKNYEIFDYEIIFSSGSLGYTYYINNFDIPYSQKILLNFNTGTGIITTNTYSPGGIRLLKIYKKHKLFLERVLGSQDVYTGSFRNSSFYKITGTLSGKILNEIGIKYYTDDNIIKNGNNYLMLNYISTKSSYTDPTTLCNSLLIIKNIGGKKTISCGTNPWTGAYLFFNRNGVEDFIKIN